MDDKQFNIFKEYDTIVSEHKELDPWHMPRSTKPKTQEETKALVKKLMSKYGDELFDIGFPFPTYIVDEDPEYFKNHNKSYKTTQELEDYRIYNDESIDLETKQNLFRKRLREQLERQASSSI